MARLQVRRTWPSLAACALTAVLLVKLAFASGGYFPTGYLPVGALAFGGLAIVLVAHVPQWTFATHALFAVASLAALTAWTGLSATWSSNSAGGIEDLQADAVYVAIFALSLVAAGSGRHARLIPWTVLGVVVVVCGAGLLSRLSPDLVHGAGNTPGPAGNRLAYPLTYWNAYGAMAAMGIVLAAGLAADAAAPVIARAVAGGTAVPLAVALWFSLSRGSWLALIVGLVVLLAFAHHRGSMLVSLAIVGGASVLAVVRLQSYKVLTDNPSAAGAQGAGHRYLTQLILITLACAVAMGLIAGVRRSVGVMDAGRRMLRPVGLAVLGLVVLVSAVFYVADTQYVEGHAADRGTAISHWVSRQWQDFLTPTTFTSNGSTRLTTAKGGRSDLYRVAIDGFQAHPLRGDGASGFTARWYRERRVLDDVVDAHSLELQTLGELGLVGVVLLLGFLGAILLAGARARRRAGALTRGQATAVIAGFSVWLAHSAVDWDWQMPALTGTALLLGAALFPEGLRRIRRAPASSSAGSG